MTHRFVVIALSVFVVSCGDTANGPGFSVASIPSKEEVKRQGKADMDLCLIFGFESGCDVCAEYGWYGDGVCDEFCVGPDSDCQEKNKARFECYGVTSNSFFDLVIVDEGDQEGTVVVDDGGAPRTFQAFYDEGRDALDRVEHTFFFGFDDRNEGLIPQLHSIEVSSVSHAFLFGKADYDGIEEKIVCYDLKTLEEKPSFNFDCLSIVDLKSYELTITDAGDEEGEIRVNSGGAPATYSAGFDEASDNGFASFTFVFGFDELNAGDIDELYSIVIDERSFAFYKGDVIYDQASPLVCYKPHQLQ